jgi:hypothetical protein
MFIHCVYFWLKRDLTTEQAATFKRGVNSLTGIESVRHGYVGVPAATDRPIIDRSYSYALTLVFDDERAHDQYQTHQTHDEFREQCSPFWTKVLIYDSVTEE